MISCMCWLFNSTSASRGVGVEEVGASERSRDDVDEGRVLGKGSPEGVEDDASLPAHFGE
jgi:hypothetical protein